MKYSVFILIVFSWINLLGQIDPKLSDSIIPQELSRKIEKDPKLLTQNLIAGKTSDKEKFDAIFTWVVFNIDYDYKASNSTRGTSTPRILKILRRQKGVCLDFTYLMDTLCSIAGVQNTTITGYVKDNLFDLNDPIYADNHAWNAVNFNGMWYLYDVTWSSGYNQYELSRFSKRIQKWKDALKKRYKLKQYKIVSFFPGNKDCGIKRHKEIEYKSFKRLPFFYNLWDRILSWFPYCFKRSKLCMVDQTFYLCQPEVLAITHFPDNPYWSLTPRIRTFTDYSGDSLFYHLNKEMYNNQKKEGRKCIECDDFLRLNEINKNKEMIKKSNEFNENNKFITSVSDINIARIFYKMALKENDSLAKMNLSDSCLFYINRVKKDLRQCRLNSNEEQKFHKQKNNLKEKSMLAVNKIAMKKFLNTYRICKRQIPKMLSYKEKKKTNRRRYNQFQRKLNLIWKNNNYENKKKMKEDKILSTQNNLTNTILKIDSLTLRIKSYQNSFVQQIDTLKKNLWEKLNIGSPIVSNYRSSRDLRRYYLLDDRDKKIHELQLARIPLEADYFKSIENEIIEPSDSSYKQFKEIYLLNKRRFDEYLKAVKLIGLLQQVNAIPSDSLQHFINSKEAELQEEICWLSINDLSLKSIVLAYKLFIDNQELIFASIRFEDSAERIRHQKVDWQIVRNNYRRKNIIRGNLSSINSLKDDLIEKKKRFLLEIKKQQSKARKKSI